MTIKDTQKYFRWNLICLGTFYSENVLPPYWQHWACSDTSIQYITIFRKISSLKPSTCTRLNTILLQCPWRLSSNCKSIIHFTTDSSGVRCEFYMNKILPLLLVCYLNTYIIKSRCQFLLEDNFLDKAFNDAILEINKSANLTTGSWYVFFTHPSVHSQGSQ